MGELSEFSRTVRLFLRAYPWRRVDPVPWATLQGPLSQARVALVTSAALVLPGQPAFDESARGGDPSHRVIPGDADVSQLRDTHRSQSFDHAGVATDPNLGFPLDRLRELEASGRIGSVAPRHLSFMGSITAPGRLVKHSAPEAARLLVEDEVDVALLVPV
ncbi:MAG: glycine/sarcosine/betaine reductase selenoprotein B family protein [Myxococcota bacterium]